MNRRHLQLHADLRGIGVPVRLSSKLSEGRICVAGDAVSPQLALRAPISGASVLGYRLVGVIEPGATPHSRRKAVDVSVVLPFALRLACGVEVSVLTASAELLAWPPSQQAERRLAGIHDQAREAIARAHPERIAELSRQFTVFWFEWILPINGEVRVLCRARRVTRVQGAFSTYRTPPVAWELQPLETRPLSLVAGDVREVLAGLGRHPRYMPERLVGVERPRRGPRIGL